MAATVEHVVRVALDASVGRFLAHEPGVRAGGDPEDVHQARVACRRMRSDLRTFRDFVDTEWATDLRAELRWLGGELGAVRDKEVLLDRLREHAAALPLAEHETVERVTRRLTADWEASRTTLLAALDTARFRALRARMQDAAIAPRCTDAAQEHPRESLPAVVRRPWKRVRNAVAALGDDPADEALHEVRILAKRARYAAEAVVSVFGADAGRFAAAMAEVQDVLGEHQDAVVARQWLSKTAVECSPVEAYAVGMLADVEWRAGAAARSRFRTVWRDARQRYLRRWL